MSIPFVYFEVDRVIFCFKHFLVHLTIVHLYQQNYTYRNMDFLLFSVVIFGAFAVGFAFFVAEMGTILQVNIDFLFVWGITFFIVIIFQITVNVFILSYKWCI